MHHQMCVVFFRVRGLWEVRGAKLRRVQEDARGLEEVAGGHGQSPTRQPLLDRAFI